MEYMVIIDTVLTVALLIATIFHMYMAVKSKDNIVEIKHLLWAILALVLIGGGA